jgi:cation diffusion facilitator family transporter
LTDSPPPTADSCGCHADQERTERDPAYRKALWLVASMNLGFGCAEIVGGFIAKSQALKADALDFLGDGSITFVALLALAWTAAARARVALVQGLFLAGLGIWVIFVAAWRALNAVPPEAELMGGIGVVALLINVAAALILSRFREGDANVRAVWLFSRNDALANLAVILAALAVGWTDSAWPDLIVAGCIALLFLHSSIEIIRDARRELGGRHDDP